MDELQGLSAPISDSEGTPFSVTVGLALCY